MVKQTECNWVDHKSKFHVLAPKEYKHAVVTAFVHCIYRACCNIHDSLEKAKSILKIISSRLLWAYCLWHFDPHTFTREQMRGQKRWKCRKILQDILTISFGECFCEGDLHFEKTENCFRQLRSQQRNVWEAVLFTGLRKNSPIYARPIQRAPDEWLGLGTTGAVCWQLHRGQCWNFRLHIKGRGPSTDTGSPVDQRDKTFS